MFLVMTFKVVTFTKTSLHVAQVYWLLSFLSFKNCKWKFINFKSL